MRIWRGGALAAALLVLTGCSVLIPGAVSYENGHRPGAGSTPVVTTGAPTTGNPTSTASGTASSSPATSSSATSSAPEPTGAASTPSNSRPTTSVPKVIPRGFVAPPPGRGMSRYTNQQFNWTSCRGDEQCATVAVPLDYADPDGQAITLSLARQPSTAEKSLGTLFVNPGGPGGSGVDFVHDFHPKSLRAYDIVGWDPRGVGESTPVECFNDEKYDAYAAIDVSPDSAKELKALEAESKAFGRSCLDKSGALLQHISTEETVRDLDLLRQIAGSPKLDFFGFSYGTAIGARYAQLYPEHVGRLVLDGAVSLDDDTGSGSGAGNGSGSDYGSSGVGQSVGFDRALNDFATWAAQHDSKLGTSKKQVLKRITTLWDDLDQHPLRVEDRELTQALAVAGTVLVLYSNSDYYKYLNTALTQAVFDDNGYALLYYADQLNERAKDGSYGQTNFAFPAIRCLDTPDDGVAASVKEWQAEAKGSSIFGKYFGPDLTCPTWPVPAKVYNDGSLTAVGADPIVVVGTTRDPATPYEGAQSMAQQLTSGVLLTLKGDGHTAYDQSTCISRKVDAYLLHGTVPKDGTTCSS